MTVRVLLEITFQTPLICVPIISHFIYSASIRSVVIHFITTKLQIITISLYFVLSSFTELLLHSTRYSHVCVIVLSLSIQHDVPPYRIDTSDFRFMVSKYLLELPPQYLGSTQTQYTSRINNYWTQDQYLSNIICWWVVCLQMSKDMEYLIQSAFPCWYLRIWMHSSRHHKIYFSKLTNQSIMNANQTVKFIHSYYIKFRAPIKFWHVICCSWYSG